MKHVTVVKVIFIDAVMSKLKANGFLKEDAKEVVFENVDTVDIDTAGLFVSFTDTPDTEYFYPMHQIARIKQEYN
ncbi:hypothetical protein [Providencia phage PSTCR5]|uniref:Uncharacterized protein n=1 Tax=Providencia phage PSTCR5 TaxID=2783547 RepID=A0A873WTE6_9CAUD|nr:hypothetical protein KNV68_gp056 [Providencia phage PSTCR5]QPB12154.1 hypothetical protein [Providencia phage PSTCR5]